MLWRGPWSPGRSQQTTPLHVTRAIHFLRWKILWPFKTLVGGKNNKLFLHKMGQTFRPCRLLRAHKWRLWPRIVSGLRLLSNTSHCLRTLSLSLPSPLYFSIHIPFWGEILHYFCFVLGCLLSLSLLTRGNKRNKQKQGISCLAATDIGLTALQRGRHLRLWMEESAAAWTRPGAHVAPSLRISHPDQWHSWVLVHVFPDKPQVEF